MMKPFNLTKGFVLIVCVILFTAVNSYTECLKGNCKNGYGELIFSDGMHYTGEFIDGKRNGQGTLVFKDGTKYVGGFVNNKFNGQGTLIFQDGTKYVGGFEDSSFNGQGVLNYPGGIKYVGEFKNGKEHGQGTFTFQDGTQYSGDCRKGKMTGQGTRVYKSGLKYTGGFKDGSPDGQGTYFVKDGSKYIGGFKNGKREGKGLFTSPSGIKFIVEYKNGVDIGFGGVKGKRLIIHKDAQAVINYLKPLARTQVSEIVLNEVANLIAKVLATQKGISPQRRRSWIDNRGGKPVCQLDQVGDARWAGRVPKAVQLSVRNAIDKIYAYDPIGLFAFNNPFSYNRESLELSRYYPERLKNRKFGKIDGITGEYVLSGADGLFHISSLNRGKSFSIEKHRRVLEKYKILAATYTKDGGKTNSYYFFWFEKAPPDWKKILKDLPQGQGLEKIGPPVKFAPDTLNQAASMVFDYKAKLEKHDNINTKPSVKKLALLPKLINPDGFFVVSKRAIVECEVIKKDKNGNYRVNWYIVTAKGEKLFSGNLAYGGWWYPEYQQSYIEPYLFFGKGHNCNGWKKDWGQWTSILVPDVFQTQSGLSFRGYTSSGNSPAQRRHGTRECAHVQTKGWDCKIKCTNWLYGDKRPDSYMLKDKDQALSLYYYLNTRGAKIITLAQARKQAQAAKEAKAAKEREKAKKEQVLAAVLPLLSKNRANFSFPDEIKMSARIHDFLLARFYPKKLNQEMLEAMMSSRWAYENKEQNPYGGRFFKKNARMPTYKELTPLAHYFRPWLLERANALPRTFYMEVSVLKTAFEMKIGSQCYQFFKQDGTAAEFDRQELQKIEEQRNRCNKQKRDLQSDFDNCEYLRKDLKMFKEQLAEARSKGCGDRKDKNISKNKGKQASTQGPCDIPENFSFSDMQSVMMKCIQEKCGMPTPGKDMSAYKSCVKQVGEQFKSKMKQMAGQSPMEQGNDENSRNCRSLKKRISKTEQRLARSQCDLHEKKPVAGDCITRNPVQRLNLKDLDRIGLEQMLHCSPELAVFNHIQPESAVLLPRKRPFYATNFSFMLYLNEPVSSYDPPELKKKSEQTVVDARIKLTIIKPDSRSLRRGQLGLKARMKSLEFK